MKDTYRLVGPPRATPVAFAVEWRIMGSGDLFSSPENPAGATVFSMVAEGDNLSMLDDGTFRRQRPRGVSAPARGYRALASARPPSIG